MCRKQKQVVLPDPESVGAIKALNLYYEAKVVPAEKRHQYQLFYTPQYSPTELEARLAILCCDAQHLLFIGQADRPSSRPIFSRQK